MNRNGFGGVCGFFKALSCVFLKNKIINPLSIGGQRRISTCSWLLQGAMLCFLKEENHKTLSAQAVLYPRLEPSTSVIQDSKHTATLPARSWDRMSECSLRRAEVLFHLQRHADYLLYRTFLSSPHTAQSVYPTQSLQLRHTTGAGPSTAIEDAVCIYLPEFCTKE